MNRFAIGQEIEPPTEKKAIAELITLSTELLNKKAHPVQRQQHPKSHGCVKAEFIVEDVPEHLRFGVFRQPRVFPAFVRFSNGSGINQPDSKGDVRGMAIKLLGVEGEKLFQSEKNAGTQDFILINYPVLFLKDAQDALEFSKALRRASKMRIPPLKLLTIILSYAITHRQQSSILKAIQA
jgi:catalase